MGSPLALAPKTFELLLILVRSGGRALSRQELVAALWPDTFVEEANLSFQISTLRKTLGEGAEAWIETVPKLGYRFTPTVRTEPAAVAAATGALPPSPRPPADDRGQDAGQMLVRAAPSRAPTPCTGGRRARGAGGRRAGVAPHDRPTVGTGGTGAWHGGNAADRIHRHGGLAKFLAGRRAGRVPLERPATGQRRRVRQGGRRRRAGQADVGSRARSGSCLVTGRQPPGLPEDADRSDDERT